MAEIKRVGDVMMSNFTKVEGMIKVSDALQMTRSKKLMQCWLSLAMIAIFMEL